jgi:hypothetical protein
MKSGSEGKIEGREWKQNIENREGTKEIEKTKRWKIGKGIKHGANCIKYFYTQKLTFY